MVSATLENLDEALRRIDRPGTFCVSGSVPAVLPGLEVEGLGPVGLPLTSVVAKELIKRCHQAPYGKGETTLVDTGVRRVWRIEPDHFDLKNPEWDRVVQGIVAKVQEGLGLEDQKLGSELYDLLLYEPGSFFLPHRDGEKRDRMVATLVVALPSSHEGGELIVRHDAEERTIDFGGPSSDPFRTHYAAFYADCEHEVRPLKKGYRLCLVYNLTLAKSKKPLAAPRDSEHVERIAPYLREWAEDGEATEKLAVTLDHQYTGEGLSWDALKGTDRVKARVLAEAAAHSGCRAYLALLTFHQSGYGEEAGGGYGYGRRRRYDRDEEDEIDSDYEMVEVYETSLSADHWSDPEGNRLPVGELKVEEDEVLDPEQLTEVKPEEEYEGYTGNEGMTLDRWYRHAAVVIWPEERHFAILCSGDSRRVVPELVRMIGLRKRAGAKGGAALAARCRALAATIIARWPEQRYAGAEAEAEAGAEGSPASGLLEGLAALDDPARIGDFLGSALIRDVSADPGPMVVVVGQKYGWPTFQPQLVSVMRETTAESLGRNLRLLESIGSARPRKKEGWEELCTALARELIPAIEALDRKRSPTGFLDEDLFPQKADRADVLAGLARSLIATGQSELMSRFLDHAFATPKTYPLSKTHIEAIMSLRPWIKKHVKKGFPALTTWLDSVRERLEALTAREPQEPTDFRRAAPITCKCEDCTELKQFLKDPRESVHRLRANESRRKHLEHEVRRHKCDLNLKTERRGSPHTLVCTKNKASYHAAVKTYHEDQQHLATIKSIQTGLPNPAS